MQPLGHSIVPHDSPQSPRNRSMYSSNLHPTHAATLGVLPAASRQSIEAPPLLHHSETYEANDPEHRHLSDRCSQLTVLEDMPALKTSSSSKSQLMRPSGHRSSNVSFVSGMTFCSNTSKKSTILKNLIEEEASRASDKGLHERMSATESSLPIHEQRSSQAQSSTPTFQRAKTAMMTRIGALSDDEYDVLLRDDDSDEEDEHSRNKWYHVVFNPNSVFCRAWHLMTSLVVVYIIIILLIGFGFSWYKIPYGLYIFNYFIDGYCWLDMAVSFNTGYVHSGHLIMDRKKIAKHYLEFWFWTDLVANVPWEALLMVDKSNRKALKFVKWAKLPRLLRLAKLRKLLKSNARYVNVVLTLWSIVFCMHMGACVWVFIVDPCSSYYDIKPFKDWYYSHEVQDSLVAHHPDLGWECMQSSIFQIYCQALQVAASSLLGVDRLAFLGYASGGGTSVSLMEEVGSKVKELVDTAESAAENLAAARVRALKLVLLRGRQPLSLSEGMFANSLIDKWSGLNTPVGTNTFALSHGLPMDIWGTFLLLLGLYLQGSLFANLGKIVVCRHKAERRFRRAHDEVNRELDIYGSMIPEDIQERIEKHFQFRWVNQAYAPLSLLDPQLLSTSLRSELALCLYQNSVSKVTFLRSAPQAISKRVCLNLEMQSYMVHDAIYKRGEPPTGFYIVEKGVVMITSKTERFRNTTTSTMSTGDLKVSAGDHFGVGGVLAAIQDRSARATAWGTMRYESTMCNSFPLGANEVLHRKSAFAETVCQLLFLSLEAFEEICGDFPIFFKNLTNPAKNTESSNSDNKGDSSRIQSTHTMPDKFELGETEEACKSYDDDEDDYDERYQLITHKSDATPKKKDHCMLTTLPGEVPQTITSVELPIEDISAKVKSDVGSPQSSPRPNPLGKSSGTADSFQPNSGASTPATTVRFSNAEFISPLDLGQPPPRRGLGVKQLPPLFSSGGEKSQHAPNFLSRPGSPWASPEVQQEVRSLEQSVQSQGEKVERALKLIQELLELVPDAESCAAMSTERRGDHFQVQLREAGMENGLAVSLL